MNAVVLGAFFAALGVLLGAFGAHALAGLPPSRFDLWKTASHYQFVAAFGLLALGLLERRPLRVAAPSTAFLVGIFLFCGSLYAMALGAPRWLGAITPLGGISLVIGFGWLGLRARRGAG